MLIAFALMALPSSYHRLVEGGEDTVRVHRVASDVIGAALLPLAVALGLEMWIAVWRVRPVGPRGALATGVVSTAVALGLWYAGPALARRWRTPSRSTTQELDMPAASMDQKIRHVLTEARMVLPGAQALLGFQLAVVLMDAFQELPPRAQLLHLAAILLTGLAVVLLITPAAYHRIAEGGENSGRFHELASTVVLGAMIALAFALSAELALVAYKVRASAVVAASMGTGSLALLLATWFGIPLRARSARRRLAGAHARSASR